MEAITTEIAVKELWRDYYKHLGKLTSRGLTLKAKAGDWPGCAPVGYLNRREAGRACIIPDPQKARLIRQAFEWAVKETVPLNQIIAELTRKGLRSRNGKPISKSALCRLLTNPVYAGKIRFGGEVLPGNHRAIVSEELFDSAQTALARRG